MRTKKAIIALRPQMPANPSKGPQFRTEGGMIVARGYSKIEEVDGEVTVTFTYNQLYWRNLLLCETIPISGPFSPRPRDPREGKSFYQSKDGLAQLSGFSFPMLHRTNCPAAQLYVDGLPLLD